MNQQTTDTSLSPQEKIDPIYNTLAATYGELTWTSSTDPLSELVLTILSQHTSDTNRDRAFGAMRAQFPTWEEVRDAPLDLLIEAIKQVDIEGAKTVVWSHIRRTRLELTRHLFDHPGSTMG